MPRPLQVNINAPPHGGTWSRAPANSCRKSASAVCAVANVEFHGLPDTHVVRDDDGTVLRIDAHDVADQEIPGLEAFLVFADHTPQMQAVANHLLLAHRQLHQDIPQSRRRGLTAQFVDHVAFRLGDHKVRSDRSASLRYDGLHTYPAAQHDGDGTCGMHIRPEQQAIPARLIRPAGHASDHGNPRMVFVHPLEHQVGRKREGIAQQQHRCVLGPTAEQRVGPADEHAALGGCFVGQVNRL